MLDLLTRLANEQEKREREDWAGATFGTVQEFVPSELLTEARRAIKETRVIELGECGIVAGSNRKRWLVRDTDCGRLNVLDLGLGCPEEPAALADVPGNTEGKNAIACTVTILVRVGGGS